MRALFKAANHLGPALLERQLGDDAVPQLARRISNVSVFTSIKPALAFRIPENLCKLRKTRLNETPISPQRRA